MRKVLRKILKHLDKRAAKKELERIKFSNDSIKEHFKEFVSVLIENDYINLDEDCASTTIWYHKSFNLFKLEGDGNTIAEFELQDNKED